MCFDCQESFSHLPTCRRVPAETFKLNRIVECLPSVYLYQCNGSLRRDIHLFWLSEEADNQNYKNTHKNIEINRGVSAMFKQLMV